MDLPAFFVLACVAIAGLMGGSFATALTWRVPEGVSWITSGSRANRSAARSACVACGHTLHALDLVPFFSWLFLRGRCRHCRAPISIVYPLIELAVMLAYIGVWLVAGLAPASVFMMMALPFLVALLAIDLRFLILPDQLVLIVGGLGLAMRLYAAVVAGDWTGLCDGLAAAALYAGLIAATGMIMTRVLRKDALGWGDVKFFAVAGLWLGLALFPVYLFICGIAGILFGLAWRLIRKDPVFPFGPALILALYGVWLMKEAGFSL